MGKAKKLLVILLTLEFLLNTALVNKASSQHPENTIFIDPASIIDTSKTQDSTVNIGINISDVVWLHSWEIKIRYNPALLYTNETLVEEGYFLKAFGASTTFYTYLDADYLFIACSINGRDWVDGGSDQLGYLATIDFIVLREGETRLEILSDPSDLKRTKLVDVNGDLIPHTSQDGYFRNVAGGTPIASFTYRPAFPLWNENTTLDASASSDSDGISRYLWFFGDMNESASPKKENVANETTPITFHQYFHTTPELQRDFTIRLIVIDNAGTTGNVSASTLTVVSSRVPQDLAIANVYLPREIVEPSRRLSVQVTVRNNGTSTVTFNATAYSNSTMIGTQTNVTLSASYTCDLEFFWDVPTDQPLGLYIITARVTEVVNETDTSNNVYTYPGPVRVTYPPRVSFQYEPADPYVDEQIVFDASASYALVGTIRNYTWDFGEWIYDPEVDYTTTTTSPTIVHSYAMGGKYFVTLWVTDDTGVQNWTSQWINILKFPSVLSLTISPTMTVAHNTSVSGTISPAQSGAKVAIFYRVLGTGIWTSLANVTADAQGQFTYTWVPVTPGAFEFKANWTGSPRYNGCESDVLTAAVMKVTSILSLFVNPLNLQVGGTIAINGLISPIRSDAPVTILYRPRGGLWNTLENVTTSQNGTFYWSWTPSAAGVYEIKASWEGDDITNGDESDSIAVEVREQGEVLPFYRTPPSYILFLVVAAIVIIAVALFWLNKESGRGS